MMIYIFLRGILMGIADSIPGISGGTIAIIVGIYERLVTAISHCDVTAAVQFFTGRWVALAKRTDAIFLLTLLSGIATGIISSITLVHFLLTNYLPVTFAAFAGLVLGSVWILFWEIKSRNLFTYLAMILGAVAAYGIVSLDAISGSEQLGYVFGCGMIAICAMILPGISGAYVLLILGEYAIITSKVKEVAHLNIIPADLLVLVVFACGCVLGLVAFSKFLRWLLAHWHGMTMAVLCGFMLGSLKSLYPFQKMLDVKDFVALPPEAITTALCVQVALALVGGLALVLGLHWLASRN